MTTIPILYNKCAPFSGMAKFSTHKYDPTGESIVITGECVEEGWIFCGTYRDPDYPSFPLLHGPKLQVYGGTFEIIIDASKQADEFGRNKDEDSSKIQFRLTHDGTSPEVLVVYGTKQRGHS